VQEITLGALLKWEFHVRGVAPNCLIHELYVVWCVECMKAPLTIVFHLFLRVYGFLPRNRLEAINAH